MVKLELIIVELKLNFNNACNLRCKYCFTNSPKGDHVKDFLPISKLREIADEADELGFIEWDLQGGELLLRPDKLFEALDAIKPERFYLYVTTNGFKVDRKIIKELGKHGVSRMSVSLDSWDADFHDEMRGRKDFEKSYASSRIYSRSRYGPISKRNSWSL